MLTAKAVAYARESLTQELWDEILPLLHAHYHEVAHFKDMELNPHLSKYEQIQANDGLRIYTARLADNVLVGYMVAFVARSLHYADHIFANQDILFVAKEHRGSRIGVDLIKYAHSRLRADDNVSTLYQHCKAKSELNIGPMLERLLHYELVDLIYAIRLDQE